MYLKYLKYFQLVTGLVLFGVFIAAPLVFPVLHPDVYPALPVTDYFTGSLPSALILLAAGSANLMSGCYMTVHPGGRRTLQGLASLLQLLAGLTSSALVFASSPVNELPLITIIMLISGLTLHVLANLHKLNPENTVATADDSSRETGTVKWFNVSKGFGFITRDQGDDIFVHYRAIRGEGHRTLNEGQRVEFQVANKEKGLQAEDVVTARR